MNAVEFLRGWKKDFDTLFLENRIFKNKNDEVDKVKKTLNIFSPFNAKVEFNTEENDGFIKELLLNYNYSIKVKHIGRKMFTKKEYKLIEICTDSSHIFYLIELALKHRRTLDFEFSRNNQIIVTGVLYGDSGGSHTVHFNTKIFNLHEIKTQLNNIFS